MLSSRALRIVTGAWMAYGAGAEAPEDYEAIAVPPL